MKWNLYLGFVTLILSGAAAFAGEPGSAPPRHITLHDAVQLALQHNHLVRISQFKVEEKQIVKELRGGH